MRLFGNYMTLALMMLLFSCSKENKMSKIPSIEYIGMSPFSVRANDPDQSLNIGFSFQDGAADLGNYPNPDQMDIYIKDLRNDSVFTFYFPDLDPEYLDDKKGVSGQSVVYMPVYNLSLRGDSTHLMSDTTAFELYILDKAGNKSNVITTDSLVL